MSHDARAVQIGRLDERIKALQRQLAELTSQLASHDRHAEQIGRLEERIKALGRKLAELESRLAEDKRERQRYAVSWLQVLAGGLFVLAAAVVTGLLL